MAPLRFPISSINGLESGGNSPVPKNPLSETGSLVTLPSSGESANPRSRRSQPLATTVYRSAVRSVQGRHRKITRAADDTIETSRDQRMPRLDGYQPAEPAAEHKDRPDPQRAAGSEENDAKPANGIPIESPELLPVCVRRQIRVEQPISPKAAITQRLARSSRTPGLRFQR